MSLTSTLSVTSVTRRESAVAELRVMEEQVSQWLEDLLGPQRLNFWAALCTGVPLCKVLQRMGQSIKCREDAQAGTFYAVDNIAQFLAVCQAQGLVASHALFETEDLIGRKNDKRVLLCLLSLARQGLRHGLPTPSILQEELTIRAIQSKSSLTSADIERFIQEEDEARRRHSSPLWTAARPTPPMPSPLRAVPAPRHPDTTDSESPGASPGPSSRPSTSPPPKGVQRRRPSIISRSTAAEVRTAAEDHPEEGRLKLTLDVDYNLVLRAMQLKHEEQLQRLREEHTAQLEEMEALHRRGLLTLGRDRDARHSEELARRERAYEAQVASLQAQQKSVVQSLEAAHRQHVVDLEAAHEALKERELRRQEEQHAQQLEAIAVQQQRVAEEHATRLQRLREELDAEQQRQAAELQAQHEAQVAGERQQHTQDLEAERARLMAEHTTADVQQAELHYAELATMTAAHEEQVAALEREKHVAVQSTREAAVEETKALEAAHEHRVAQLREAHAAEVAGLQQQHEAAIHHLDVERQTAIARQRQELEEAAAQQIHQLEHEHEGQVAALAREVEARETLREAEWGASLARLRQQHEAERATLAEQAQWQARQSEAVQACMQEQHRIEQEGLAAKYEQLLGEAEAGFRRSLDAALQRERQEYAVALAEVRAAHARALHEQAVHQRRVLEQALKEGAEERQQLFERRAAEHTLVVDALQQEHAAHLRRALQAGDVCQHTDEGDAKPAATLQDSALRQLVADKLSVGEYGGIHLYHCRPRGSFFMRRGAVCTPEFFVRQFGGTVLAFANVWMDLDAFIQRAFALPAEPQPSQGTQTQAPRVQVDYQGRLQVLSVDQVEVEAFWADC